MNTLRTLTATALLALAAIPGLSVAAEESRAPSAGAAPAEQNVEQQLEAARQRLQAAAQEVAQLSSQLGRRFSMQLGGDGAPAPRALLGVQVARDPAGARVVSVSPGGAAAEAGLKAGDLITTIGGEDLTRDGDASRLLVEKMAQVDPDLKVQVGVLRDGKKLSFDVVPRAAPPGMMAGGPMGPGGRRILEFRGPPGADGVERRLRIEGPAGSGGPGAPGVRAFALQRGDDAGARFRGMEFATLSERLGSYFGVKSGVLVVRAGASSPFNLQDGDVILSIGGREATSAQHAARILRSYQPGEKLALRVQRDRKAQTLEVTVAAAGSRD